MSTDLLADLAAAGGAETPRLWLRASAYTRRVLLGAGADPWTSASDFLAWFTQSQGLLRPDVAVLQVDELFTSWMRRHPQLATDMAAKKRMTYPLRILLEQAGPRALLLEAVEAVIGSLRGQTPLVLAVPAPRTWLQVAAAAAGRAATEAQDEEVEDAAMYIADLVRALSNCEVGGLLLEETLPEGPVPDLATCTPIVNVAHHYRWPIGFRLDGRRSDRRIAGAAALDFLIAAEADHGGTVPLGRDVSAALWSGGSVDALAAGEFYFVEVPEAAVPETVLERLATLH